MLRANRDFKCPSPHPGYGWQGHLPSQARPPLLEKDRSQVPDSTHCTGGSVHREVWDKTDQRRSKEDSEIRQYIHSNFKRDVVQESGDFTSPWPSDIVFDFG